MAAVTDSVQLYYHFEQHTLYQFLKLAALLHVCMDQLARPAVAPPRYPRVLPVGPIPDSLFYSTLLLFHHLRQNCFLIFSWFGALLLVCPLHDRQSQLPQV